MAEHAKYYGKTLKAVWVGSENGAIEYAPVVRCKDCNRYTLVEGGKPLCALHVIAVAHDDFCSYGERRTN